MSSEYVLRLRIEQAAKDAERANRNGDRQAYERAAARYHAADAWLKQIEAEKNEQILKQLELMTDKDGHLHYAAVIAAGVPIEDMHARGWQAVPRQPFLRKVDPNGTATVVSITTGEPVAGEAGPQTHE